jgi:very-short-patch-repair endonuclease
MHELEPIDFARLLRQTATSSENYLWQLLRGRMCSGKKFRRQHPLGIYTADFYCAEAKLVIEIDGSPHQKPEGKQHDAARDAWIRSQGIEVLRFGGWQVENETRQVLEKIDAVLSERCKKPLTPANLPKDDSGSNKF